MTLGIAAASNAALPKSFHGWEGGPTQTISLPQLATAAAGDAAAIREYGFLGAERREYAKGNSTLTITLWRMQDATGSFGLYTYYGKPGMTAEIKSDGPMATGPDLLLFQRGPHLLMVEGAGLTSDAVTELVAAIPAPPPGRESLLPSLPGFLPDKGMVPVSQKYLIGPVAFARLLDRIPVAAIGFDLGAEAVLAEYRIDGRDVRLLLVSYPTPQFAAKKLRDFQNLPALSQSDSDKTLFIERKGSLVAFVMDAPNLTATEKLLAQVNYEAEVTWNEYVEPRKENVGVVMMSIFSLAGFLLVFSFVAGLAFGGVRVLVKKFVPIPIFDRPSQVEIIQLNLMGR